MHPLIVHNGTIGPMSPCLTPGQAGLLTGWGVFSTLRIYEGVPFAFELHWERMTRDAARTNVALPFPSPEIRESLVRLVEANGAPNCAARILFIRNNGGFWSTPSDRPTDFVIFTGDLHAWPASLRLTVVPQGRHADSELAGAKILAWVNNVATLETAQQRGYDEALLLNEREEVAECTSANIFAVQQGQVLTPPLGAGCLPGVTRQVLFEVARQAGVPLSEQTLKMDDLKSADEVFVTSTTRELIPVGEIDETRLAAAWPVTERLHAAFRAYVNDYLARRTGTAKSA